MILCVFVVCLHLCLHTMYQQGDRKVKEGGQKRECLSCSVVLGIKPHEK